MSIVFFVVEEGETGDRALNDAQRGLVFEIAMPDEVPVAVGLGEGSDHVRVRISDDLDADL